jgi:hypothetical protein
MLLGFFLPPCDRGVLVDNPAIMWPVMPDSPPVPVVILEHTEPGGGLHWDLLVARGPDPAARLWGLRCHECPIGHAESVIPVDPMPDHRPAWLDLEGAVRGGRGSVRRLARGVLVVRGAVAEVRWEGGRASRWRLSGSGLTVVTES